MLPAHCPSLLSPDSTAKLDLASVAPTALSTVNRESFTQQLCPSFPQSHLFTDPFMPLLTLHSPTLSFTHTFPFHSHPRSVSIRMLAKTDGTRHVPREDTLVRHDSQSVSRVKGTHSEEGLLVDRYPRTASGKAMSSQEWKGPGEGAVITKWRAITRGEGCPQELMAMAMGT